MMLFSLTLLGLATASVVILPGGDPKPLVLPVQPVAATDYNSILRTSAASEFPNSTVNILLSSYSGTLEATGKETANASEIFPSGDSFIRGAIQAWGEHLHLEIRPEEVWFTILTQLNFYMGANAEKVRHLFVKHQGQETIYIEDYTWTAVLWRFKDEIQARVLTPWLKDWIVPDFSTSTPDDVMTANILMMGLMKAYFTYEGGIICGLPSVTLLGEKADWEKLLAKLERLSEFGEEPDAYRTRLAPILKRFVGSFDAPDSAEIRKFWSQIVFAQYESMCGAAPLEISGWITGFLFWGTDGVLINKSGTGGREGLTMDEVNYAWHDVRRLPVGYAKAPFTMRDFGGMEKFPAYVAAGTLGKQIVNGPPKGYADALARAGMDAKLAVNSSSHGTIRPLSAWMLYGPLYPPGPDLLSPYDREMQVITSRTKQYLQGKCGGV
ncbi:hypothetical protein C8A05DRAFT_32878 [Staphylotrichum tortipilum]|uniref:Uncharacterized protein n=1 Tax=Staphylotrichum tortipilum TaxID=2831512 RepID=A0AAN6RUM8_9PEZI|nr:hypothetical protein C8A05DRAFT_32878 [Staphylotrichum longicolle]